MTLHFVCQESCNCAAAAAVAGPGPRAAGCGSEPAAGVGARGRAGRRGWRGAPSGARRGGWQLCQARLGPHPAAAAAAGGVPAGLPVRWGILNCIFLAKLPGTATSSCCRCWWRPCRTASQVGHPESHAPGKAAWVLHPAAATAAGGVPAGLPARWGFLIRPWHAEEEPGNRQPQRMYYPCSSWKESALCRVLCTARTCAARAHRE